MLSSSQECFNAVLGPIKKALDTIEEKLLNNQKFVAGKTPLSSIFVDHYVS